VAGFNLYFADALGKPGKKLNQQPIPDNKVTLKKVDPLRIYQFLLTAQGKAGNESPAVPLTVNYGDLKKAAAAMTAPTTQAVAKAAAALAPPPGHLTLEAKEGKVHLAWDDAGAGMKYNVYVSKDGGEMRLLTKDGLSQTTATLGPLQSDHRYTFGVSALDPAGKESEKAVQSYSAALSSTPTP
jgi:hypothetical protein